VRLVVDVIPGADRGCVTCYTTNPERESSSSAAVDDKEMPLASVGKVSETDLRMRCNQRVTCSVRHKVLMSTYFQCQGKFKPRVAISKVCT
jgi:hypothetical protein